MSAKSHLDALPHIRADLRRLRADRIRALGLYLAIFALFFVALMATDSGLGQRHDLKWALGLVGLFLGAAGSVALAMGVPLLHGRRLALALGGSLAVMLGGLALAVDMESDPAWKHGPMCFTFGTAISALFMVILGALSGRLWRRTPDPGFMIAVGTTAAGIAYLHSRCDSTHVLHVLFFHVTPLVVLYAAARWLTRVRLQLLREDGQDRPPDASA